MIQIPTFLVTLDVMFPVAKKLQEKTQVKKVILCSLCDYLPPQLKPAFPPADVAPQEGVYHFMDLLNAQSESDTPVRNMATLNDLGALILYRRHDGDQQGGHAEPCQYFFQHATIPYVVQRRKGR